MESRNATLLINYSGGMSGAGVETCLSNASPSGA